MASFGIEYVLVGPDGTRAVFNNPEDPDFVGYLNSETGITGLLDTPDVREGYFDKPEFDGGVQTDSFFSKRVGVIQGFVIPDPTMAVYNNRETKIKAASRGMRGGEPSRLYWTPEGREQMSMRVYRQGKVSFTGRRPKNFLIPLSSPDPYLFSSATAEATIHATIESEGDTGFGSPIGPELETEYKETVHLGAVNHGDAPTWPEFILNGPMVNPILINLTTGEKFQLTFSLAAGEQLLVNTLLRTVLLKATPESTTVENRFKAYAENFSTNRWFPLVKGNNNVQFVCTGFTAETSVVIKWQSAWE